MTTGSEINEELCVYKGLCVRAFMCVCIYICTRIYVRVYTYIDTFLYILLSIRISGHPSPDKHSKILVSGFRLNLVLDMCIKYCSVI